MQFSRNAKLCFDGAILKAKNKSKYIVTYKYKLTNAKQSLLTLCLRFSYKPWTFLRIVLKIISPEDKISTER